MKSSNILKKLGIFTSGTAAEKGFTNTEISRLVISGTLLKLDRGIYQHVDCQLDPNNIEYAIACTRFAPRVVVAGLSALFFYNLYDVAPSQVWIQVPTEKKSVDQKYRLLRTGRSLTLGIEKQRYFKITNLDRTLVEAFYYSSKIGLDLAMRATAIALKRRDTTLVNILTMAKNLGLESTINRHWEALSGLQEAI